MKIVEDTMMKRLKRHHKYEKIDNNIQIGHNVFLKNDKTKLKAREPYKVVELFEKNDEPWAVVQKHDSQFCLKKYNVKLDELFLLPGQLNHKTLINDLENAKYEDFQPSNDKAILPYKNSNGFWETAPNTKCFVNMLSISKIWKY